ncbi:NADP-dependent oxidoreductase domain containing protein [Tylopilus felleus]
MTVPRLTLNDGTRAPWIAFGTGTAFYGQDVTNVIQLAIENGFTHLDCAQMYHNEESVGKGISTSGKPRPELYITTKLNNLDPGQTAKTALLESLRKLGVDHVDLYLIHMPKAHAGRLQQVWKEMEECKKEGLTKSIGVSNFGVKDLEEILSVATIPPAVNQLEIHPYVWQSTQAVIELHKAHNIVTSSYGGLSPLFRAQGGPLDPVVHKIRARLETTRGSPVSDGQVLNKWLQQRSIMVVTTSSKAERIREYLDTHNVPDLTTEELRLIDVAGAQLYNKLFVSYSLEAGSRLS